MNSLYSEQFCLQLLFRHTKESVALSRLSAEAVFVDSGHYVTASKEDDVELVNLPTKLPQVQSEKVARIEIIRTPFFPRPSAEVSILETRI